MDSHTVDDSGDYSEYSDALIDLSPSNGRRLSLANPTTWEVLSPGNQIAVGFYKSGSTVIAYHHGIYIGNNAVIDMNDNTDKPAIQQRSLESFVNIGDVDRSVIIMVEYNNDSDEKRNMTIKFADFLMNTSANKENKLYNIVMLNCEVFATFCRTGNPRYQSEIENLCNDIIWHVHSNKNQYAGLNKLKR